MSLQEIEIKDFYQTDSSNIPEQFYNAIFPVANNYKRATGYFSSSSFKLIGKGLKEFYLNGGNMQLLVSPQLTEEDYEAICSGIKASEDIALSRIIQSFDINQIQNDSGANILAWLIYEKRLEIRVVVRKDNKPIGIFHDKFSIIEDKRGNKISFRGSMNEGYMAYIENFETIEVDNSWDSGVKRTEQRDEQFNDIWGNKVNKWKAVEFPQAIKDQMISIRKPIDHFESGEVTDGVRRCAIRTGFQGYVAAHQGADEIDA